jgi:heat shock protein HtpX
MAFTMLLLTALYLVFAYVLFRYTGAIILLAVIPLGGLFIQYFISDKIVLSSMGARVIQSAQAPELYGTVQRLAQQADLPMPKVAIVNSSMPNAFATGRGPKHAVVCVTTGLINQLPQPELEAVLAHEMTHIRNRDMVVMMMAGSFAAIAAWITQWGLWFGMWGEGGGRNNRDNGNAFIVVLLVSMVVWLISHLLMMALSRYREYAADRGSAILTGQPENLASALLRITGTIQRIPSQDLRQAQHLSALFFAAPSKDSLFELFSDHPSAEHRIARLQDFEARMAQVPGR